MTTTTPSKSTNAKAPGSKPKRPLSAFNLFYRFKRQKVLKALAAGSDKGTISSLVMAPPGLEHYSAREQGMTSHAGLNAHRRETIRKELEQNLEPRDNKARAHRKNQGAMNGHFSFVELGKIMNSSWKNCDEYAKLVFNELAEEGRNRYRLRLKDFNALSKNSENAKTTSMDEKKSTKIKKKLPIKKRIAVKASSACLPPKDGASFDGSVTNETAQVMVQLAKSTPCNGYKVCSSLVNQSNSAATDVGNVSEDDSILSSSHEAHAHQKTEAEERLLLRVRELERQLAEEKLRSQIREIADHRSQQRARENLLRSMLQNYTSQSKPVTMAPSILNHPFMQEGLPRLASNAQESDVASMIYRMAGPHHTGLNYKRPSSDISQNNNTSIHERPPAKKQMLESLLAARKNQAM